MRNRVPIILQSYNTTILFPYSRWLFENYRARVFQRHKRKLLLLHELFRAQPPRHENQEVVSRRHGHSRFVPVYELRLNL
jgi:hypothetical protein